MLIFWIPAIIAVVMGHLARRQIRLSGGQRRGMGLSIAGLLLGYLSIGLPLVGIAIFALARL